MIMIASTSAADSMPRPSGGPLKNGSWRIESGSDVSTHRTAATSAMSATANTPVPSRNPRSLPRCVRNSTLLRLHLAERHQLELHHGLRQRRVPELGRELLAVGERPLQEVDHHLGLRLVLGV